MKSVLAALPLLATTGAIVVTAAASPAGATVGPATTYHPVAPARVLDTRSKVGVSTSTPVPAHGRVTFSVAAKAPGATSVVLNLTVTRTTSSGFISAFNGTGTPSISNLNFAKGQTVPNLVIAQVTGGKVTLYNGSSGTVALLADLSGYYATGTSGGTQGEFTAVPPTRLLDTRKKIGVTTSTPIAANKTVTFTVTGGTNAVPAGVSAVALNLTATGPATSGFLTAYAAGASRPATSILNFKAGTTVPNLAIVPVSSSGKVTLYNGSSGTVHALADIQGYFLGGDPTTAGALGALAPIRLLPATTVAAAHAASLTVTGKGGVPVAADVSAVVLNVTVTAPATSGFLTVYGGSTRPGVSTLNFGKGQTIANLTLVAPVSGVVHLYNGSSGNVKVLADVSGYVRSTTSTIPAVSTSRYVRNLTDGGAGDQATMADEGAADQASTLVVLDIGAQLNDKSGVQLSATNTSLTYAQLVTSLNSYLSGYAGAGGAGTVAIATNNGGTFSTYTAAMRGTDWANDVIDALSVPAGVTVKGANDIESGFSGTEVQAEQWITGYLAATSKNFLYIGSADGCPTTYGTTGETCANGWTEAQYVKLTHGLSPNRITALPQIYLPAQAVQWANIAKTGSSTAAIVGALTENAACPTASSAGCTFAALTPAQGWAALFHALSTVVAAPSLPVVSDLRIDG